MRLYLTLGFFRENNFLMDFWPTIFCINMGNYKWPHVTILSTGQSGKRITGRGSRPLKK
jgi:hypothetical protein